MKAPTKDLCIFITNLVSSYPLFQSRNNLSKPNDFVDLTMHDINAPTSILNQEEL